MKNHAIRLSVLGMTAALMAAGCAAPGIQQAYQGPARPDTEVATIVGITTPASRAWSPSRERLSFMDVDDESTVPWYSIRSYPTAIRVLPGKHKLGLQYEHVHGVARGPVWVDARDNRTYQVKVMNPQARTERVYFVVEDITAQTLVGGGTESKAEE